MSLNTRNRKGNQERAHGLQSDGPLVRKKKVRKGLRVATQGQKTILDRPAGDIEDAPGFKEKGQRWTVSQRSIQQGEEKDLDARPPKGITQ